MRDLASPIRLELSHDGLSATLSIPPATPKAEVSELNLQALLTQRDISITQERLAAIRAVVASYQPSDTPAQHVIARGVAPVNGADGAVEVFPDVLRPPDVREPDSTSRASRDPRARLRIITVSKGQHIGRLHPHTLGVDGVDVRGQTLPARPGRAAPTTIAQSVIVRDDGALLAGADGVVELSGASLRVSTTLQLASVDFSTGNVDFPGDILVLGDVRDGFRLHASHDIKVRGLIDAATIDADRDVVLEGSMACPKGGELSAGRDLAAQCLNNVRCRVGRDATITRELLDCRMIVGRRLTAPKATIVRGQVTVAAGVDIGSIGCESHAVTLVAVARTPDIDRLTREVGRLVPVVVTQRDAACRKLEEISQQRSLSHALAEQQTELRFIIESATALAERLGKGCDAMIDWKEKRTKAELVVRAAVYPGAKIELGPWLMEVHDRVAGPVKFFLRESGALMVMNIATGRVFPATDVARVRHAPDSPNLSELSQLLRGERKAS